MGDSSVKKGSQNIEILIDQANNFSGWLDQIISGKNRPLLYTDSWLEDQEKKMLSYFEGIAYCLRKTQEISNEEFYFEFVQTIEMALEKTDLVVKKFKSYDPSYNFSYQQQRNQIDTEIRQFYSIGMNRIVDTEKSEQFLVNVVSQCSDRILPGAPLILQEFMESQIPILLSRASSIKDYIGILDILRIFFSKSDYCQDDKFKDFYFYLLNRIIFSGILQCFSDQYQKNQLTESQFDLKRFSSRDFEAFKDKFKNEFQNCINEINDVALKFDANDRPLITAIAKTFGSYIGHDGDFLLEEQDIEKFFNSIQDVQKSKDVVKHQLINQFYGLTRNPTFHRALEEKGEIGPRLLHVLQDLLDTIGDQLGAAQLSEFLDDLKKLYYRLERIPKILVNEAEMAQLKDRIERVSSILQSSDFEAPDQVFVREQKTSASLKTPENFWRPIKSFDLNATQFQRLETLLKYLVKNNVSLEGKDSVWHQEIESLLNKEPKLKRWVEQEYGRIAQLLEDNYSYGIIPKHGEGNNIIKEQAAKNLKEAAQLVKLQRQLMRWKQLLSLDYEKYIKSVVNSPDSLEKLRLIEHIMATDFLHATILQDPDLHKKLIENYRRSLHSLVDTLHQKSVNIFQDVNFSEKSKLEKAVGETSKFYINQLMNFFIDDILSRNSELEIQLSIERWLYIANLSYKRKNCLVFDTIYSTFLTKTELRSVVSERLKHNATHYNRHYPISLWENTIDYVRVLARAREDEEEASVVNPAPFHSACEKLREKMHNAKYDYETKLKIKENIMTWRSGNGAGEKKEQFLTEISGFIIHLHKVKDSIPGGLEKIEKLTIINDWLEKFKEILSKHGEGEYSTSDFSTFSGEILLYIDSFKTVESSLSEDLSKDKQIKTTIKDIQLILRISKDAIQGSKSSKEFFSEIDFTFDFKKTGRSIEGSIRGLKVRLRDHEATKQKIEQALPILKNIQSGVVDITSISEGDFEYIIQVCDDCIQVDQDVLKYEKENYEEYTERLNTKKESILDANKGGCSVSGEILNELEEFYSKKDALKKQQESGTVKFPEFIELHFDCVRERGFHKDSGFDASLLEAKTLDGVRNELFAPSTNTLLSREVNKELGNILAQLKNSHLRLLIADGTVFLKSDISKDIHAINKITVSKPIEDVKQLQLLLGNLGISLTLEDIEKINAANKHDFYLEKIANSKIKDLIDREFDIYQGRLAARKRHLPRFLGGASTLEVIGRLNKTIGDSVEQSKPKILGLLKELGIDTDALSFAQIEDIVEENNASSTKEKFIEIKKQFGYLFGAPVSRVGTLFAPRKEALDLFDPSAEVKKDCGASVTFSLYTKDNLFKTFEGQSIDYKQFKFLVEHVASRNTDLFSSGFYIKSARWGNQQELLFEESRKTKKITRREEKNHSETFACEAFTDENIHRIVLLVLAIFVSQGYDPSSSIGDKIELTNLHIVGDQSNDQANKIEEKFKKFFKEAGVPENKICFSGDKHLSSSSMNDDDVELKNLSRSSPRPRSSSGSSE